MSFRKSRWLTLSLLVAVLLSACNIGATPPPTQDTNALQTQSVEGVFTQVAAQQTQTAAAIPPTPLPTFTPPPTNTLPPVITPTVLEIPTNTPFDFNTPLAPAGLATATLAAGAISTVTTKNGCNDGYLVSESQPYDGKTIALDTEFQKTWTFLNTGTCAWDEGYSFAFVQEFSNGPKYGNGKDYVIPKEGPYTKPGESRSFTVTLKAPNKPGTYTWYYKIKDDSGQFFGSLVWVTVVSVIP